ncbi:MAG: hypothetical protein Q9218_004358 [Villophora microphyllina]
MVGFLSLPRELRNTIYHYYVFEADGYYFEYESGKLRTSGNRPIDLALMYTCTFVAAEMHQLALRSNTLNFATICSDKAYRFEVLFEQLRSYRDKIVHTLIHPTISLYHTPDMDVKLLLRFPQFEPWLQLLRKLQGSGISDGSCRGFLTDCPWPDVVDSAFRDFQGYMIELLSRDTDFPEALAKFYDAQAQVLRSVYRINRLHQNMATFLNSTLLWSGPEPWTIPSDEELARADEILGPPPWTCSLSKRVRWRFSAAAAAIHFFKSASRSTRLGTRNIVLHEDRQCVAYPECHISGLISLCLQNPQLHIERRINIWRNVLVSVLSHHSTEHRSMTLEWALGANDKFHAYDRHIPKNISRTFSPWITEASALSTNGIPINSFSLIFDGDPALDQSSEIFEILKDDAAWQVAQVQWYTENSMSSELLAQYYPEKWRMPGSLGTKVLGFYVSEDFPQALDDIVQGKSCIRCNFPLTGNLYDPKRVLERNQHLIQIPTGDPDRDRPPSLLWHRRWLVHRYHNPVRLSPPLPSFFADLALEDIISDEQQHVT